ncbi:MAG: SEC-C domain-containing protein, partial [Proteobacteria bacterium]|nr:SEC-C domain-containing protein [Pseudomonadota bacterium]
KAQKKVEARNFDTRKNVLKYDDVMNAQRKEMYAQRKEFMKATDVSETVGEMRHEVIAAMVASRIPEKAFSEQWQLAELAADVERVLNLTLPVQDWGTEEGIDEHAIRERIERAADSMLAAKAANLGPDLWRFVEKSLLIQTLDAVWKEHLHALDHLRQGIVLRAYGQKDPLNEYKSEAFALFNAMLDDLKERVTAMLSRVQLQTDQEPEPLPPPQRIEMTELHPEPQPVYGAAQDYAAMGAGGGTGEMVLDYAGGAAAAAVAAQPLRAEAADPNDPSTWRSTPRNAPCPCGSGRKYKHCHGRLA